MNTHVRYSADWTMDRLDPHTRDINRVKVPVRHDVLSKVDMDYVCLCIDPMGHSTHKGVDTYVAALSIMQDVLDASQN
jgi:hypothetical protein